MEKIYIFLISILFFSNTACFADVDTVKLVKQTMPSLVLVELYDENDKFVGHGSGFFVTNNGDVLTNAHVARGGTKCVIRTNDGMSHQGQIKAIHNGQDIALLCISSNKYKPLKIYTATPQAGAYAVALGAPLGYTNTVSDGLVSGIRNIKGYNFLQVSCPISPGSSGGPIVNEQGQVIGMSTFILDGGNNMSFCVPSQQMKMFVEQSKKLVPQSPSVLIANNKNASPSTPPASKPTERLVFMVKHDEKRDGFIETYLDTHSVTHRGSIISCVLLSKMGKSYAQQFSRNGILADVSIMSIEMNSANRTSRILQTLVVDAKGQPLYKDDEVTNWSPMEQGTCVVGYLSYILLSGL